MTTNRQRQSEKVRSYPSIATQSKYSAVLSRGCVTLASRLSGCMLILFVLHSSHVVPEPRKQFKTLGPRTKWWIKWLRAAQIGFRILELVAAAGILFLFIIIDNVNSLTAWVERITVSLVPPLRASPSC